MAGRSFWLSFMVVQTQKNDLRCGFETERGLGFETARRKLQTL
jgi:hypothetical protein